MLPIVRAWWTLACTYANKCTNLATGPFIDCRFVQNLRRRIIGAGTFVDKNMLSNLNWFESKPSG
jgi:hypothetical protein